MKPTMAPGRNEPLTPLSAVPAPRSSLRVIAEVGRTGLTSIRLHPLRSVVTVACLVAVLLPYLVGLGISCGLQDGAERAVQSGPDLYVSDEQFGRPAAFPVIVADDVRAIPGVASVTTRIVGQVEIGKEQSPAVLVGLPVADFPSALECIEGRLYDGRNRHEIVIGSELARRLHVKVGDVLPPFPGSRAPARLVEVVGIFRSDVSLWQAHLIVTSLETAAQIFDQPGLATDLLVRCRPGYQEQVAEAIEREKLLHKPRIVAREEMASILLERPQRREGVFTMRFTVAFAVGILAILVTSGFGLSERRREVGILKATGWQTDELLLRSLSESLLLSLIGASLALIAAVVWLRGFNGWWIAGIFLNDVETQPAFRVPFRLLPIPVMLAFLIALVIVMSGSLYSTWWAATAPPREAMR